jgi:glutamine synthetase
MGALDGDTVLRDAIGSHVVDHYLAMKRAEQDMLNAMSEGERRVWLMDRY